MTSSSTRREAQSSAAPPASPALSRREIAWGQRLLALFVLLVSLPYLWCALLTPPGMTWGGLIFAADDQNVHLMWARQAQEGGFFMRDLFTTEGLVSGDRPLFVNVFALALGWFSRLSHLDGAFGYHVARVAFAALFVHQLHKLLVAATNGAPERENARLGALALAVLTTGGGFVLAASLWMAAHLGTPSLAGKLIFFDHPANTNFVTVPEAFALLSALIYPIYIASFALLCFLLRALIENRHPVKAFFAALILANMHTYDALPLGSACLVICLLALVRREGFKDRLAVWGAVVGGLAIPVAYQALVFGRSPEFRIKALTPTSTSDIWAVLASFSPLLLLALWSRRAAWAQGARRWLWTYAGALLVLIYLPKSPRFLFQALFVPHEMFAPLFLFSFARKMLEGLQIPLLVFAGAGLARLPKRRWLAPVVVAVCSISPMVFFAWTLQNAAENNASRHSILMPGYYLWNADVGALQTLAQVPQKDKNVAVLCLPWLGSYVPRATGLFVYTGHWAETLDPTRKNGETVAFYRGQMSPGVARAWLKANHIGYIIESFDERAVAAPGGDLSAYRSVPRELGLKPIYAATTLEAKERGETVVYRVSN